MHAYSTDTGKRGNIAQGRQGKTACGCETFRIPEKVLTTEENRSINMH